MSLGHWAETGSGAGSGGAKEKSKLALFIIAALLPFLVAGSATPREQNYLSPSEIVVSADGSKLYVLCERGEMVLVMDALSGEVKGRVAVGRMPRGIALSPDGCTLYVTNSWDDTLSVIDTPKLAVTSTWPTGFEPWGVQPDRSGAFIYVANRLSNSISVINAVSGVENRRLRAGRGVSFLALSADGRRIYATHVFPNFSTNRAVPESEITVIDTERQMVADRISLRNVAGIFHLAISRDGNFGVAAHLRPKNLIPLAHVEHGWAFGDGFTFFGPVIGNVQVPIDELERYFTMPYGAAILPDGSHIYLSDAGSDTVTVIDTPRLLGYAKKQKKSFANDLSTSAHYTTTQIEVGSNPRGIALSPNGSRLYVANRLDDSITVIDTESNRVKATFDLGGVRIETPLRHGERLFNSTRFAFQGQFGCANCHIDGTFDGMTWDLEPDGFGKDIVDNRNIEDLRGTEPFKWNGGNPDLATECGPRTEKFFFRSQGYSAQELADLVKFIESLPARPNRYRQPDGELTPAQERGKAIFFRTVDRNGKPIPEANQCAFCHSGPKYTNRTKVNVGSGRLTDRSPTLDVPHLVNVWMTAPYMHDGAARSLEEIWTIYNPNDTHGVSNDLTKDELNDLIEYLRTL